MKFTIKLLFLFIAKFKELNERNFNMDNYTLVLLSGGIGSRMRNPIPKQYMLLAGKPMIIHTLERIDCIDSIVEVIIVCSDEYVDKLKIMLNQYNIKKQVRFASSGKTRQASVLSGLEKVNTENVIIHESARPFVSSEDFIRLIENEYTNSFFGIDIPFTVIKGKAYIEDILNRDELINVQLPQKFNTNLLLESHKRALQDKKEFTEDVSLLYYYNPNVKIKMIQGKDYNIKITTRTDMLVGEIIYDEYFRRRK